MENDPPGIETLPLTKAQTDARTARVAQGLRLKREANARTANLGLLSTGTAATTSMSAQVPDPAASTDSNTLRLQAAAALKAAMEKHGSDFRVRVMSAAEWDAVASLRMRADKCDKATALEREGFVTPFINVRR